MTTCIHCNQDCRKTDGKEVYPHRSDLWEKIIYVCDPCNARVGCHGTTDNPLGYAANAELREARIILHNRMIDPLWKRQRDKKTARNKVYKYLANAMGLPREETHTGMFTLEQCREAWKCLKGKTFEDLNP